MESSSTQPRRPNLATIVGSGLAIVAAGSLIAFSSLAEQAGLQGLATGGLRPAAPSRAGVPPRAITIPAPPTAPPQEPGDAVSELVRRVVERDEPARPQPRLAVVPAPRGPKPKPSRVDGTRRVAVAGPNVAPEAEAGEWSGPPYGHAYGYHKKRGERPEPAQAAKKKGRKGKQSTEAPVYARRAADDEAKGPKPTKSKKVKKAPGPDHGKSNGRGKAKGHSKHDAGAAKGHSKHGRGKAKGHSKHGR